MRFSRPLLATCLLLSACAPLTPNSAPANSGQLRAQAANGLSAQFSAKPALPELNAITAQAQAYSDETSKRRGIDFFRLHPNPVGIKLSQGAETSWLLSYLGTARERDDLNVELRVVGTNAPGMNLNYSGPVTLSRAQNQPKTDVKAVPKAATGFSYELVQGLPGNGVTEAYEAYADAFGQFLRSRYQAQPFSFDDGPLVYAISFNGQLQAFAFFNQGNRLILGERKYADVQSVTVFSTQRKLLAAYTLIGFNPKTPGAETDPVWQTENDSRFGTLVQFGEL